MLHYKLLTVDFEKIGSPLELVITFEIYRNTMEKDNDRGQLKNRGSKSDDQY